MRSTASSLRSFATSASSSATLRLPGGAHPVRKRPLGDRDSFRGFFQRQALGKHQLDGLRPELRRVCRYFHKFTPFDKFIKRKCPRNSGYLSPIAVGKKNWPFTDSERAGRRAAAIRALLATAKRNGLEPLRWLSDTLEKTAHLSEQQDRLLAAGCTALQDLKGGWDCAYD